MFNDSQKRLKPFSLAATFTHIVLVSQMLNKTINEEKNIKSISQLINRI